MTASPSPVPLQTGDGQKLAWIRKGTALARHMAPGCCLTSLSLSFFTDSPEPYKD